MDAWIKTRKQAAAKKRRMIMNNDGNDACGYGIEPKKISAAIEAGADAIAEIFWSQRCAGLEQSQIDSVFYCSTMGFNLHTHDSRVAELFSETYDMANQTVLNEALIEHGRDGLQLTIDYCRKASREVFWSQRMNDTHDNWFPTLMSEFKKQHPSLLLFQEEDIGRIRLSPDHIEPHMAATAVDYGQQQVRDQQFAMIQDVCQRYDIDGIELDFMRHPVYFRPTMEGQPVEAEHVAMMTDFMRRLREMTERIGRKRDRPLLVACLIPNRIQCCMNIGLDIENWLAADLIDLITLSLERDQFTGEVQELVEGGHRHQVPVYVCLSEEGFNFPAVDRMASWAGAATHALSAGADGLYTYNHFDPRSPVFHTIGDPAKVAKMDKVFAIDNLSATIRSWESAYQREKYLPQALTPDTHCRLTLPVGEDVSRGSLSVQIQMDQMSSADQIQFMLNGHSLDTRIVSIAEGISPAARGKWQLQATPDPIAVKEGDNEFCMLLKDGPYLSEIAPVLTGLQLVVKYE